MINDKLNIENRNIQLYFLIKLEAFEYIFIDCYLVLLICNYLGIKFMIILKPKHMHKFNEVIAKQSFTYCLHFNIILQKHKKLTVLIFITDLKSHNAILNKF